MQTHGAKETERHLLSLGLAGVAEQSVTGSLLFGCVDAISAHRGFHHGHTALFLHSPVGEVQNGVNLPGNFSNDLTCRALMIRAHYQVFFFFLHTEICSCASTTSADATRGQQHSIEMKNK